MGDGGLAQMDDQNRDLAAEITAAWVERAIWGEGCKAYREHGATAINPYSPRTPAHAVWVKGYEYQRALTSQKKPSW
ncbi:hypothetical protein [Jiella sp. M17.18]|uniref:hypothetical protein n=1 Tax=Jiella sp. M17.18 TaxID=3234247 RepID=UPI0034DF8170